MICDVCRREAHGLGWASWNRKTKATIRQLHACSLHCQDIIHGRNGILDDMTPNEIASVQDAAAAGGQFLDALGKTDLATMSVDEWHQFIDAVCTGYVEAMKQRAGWSLREKEGVPY